MIVEKLVKELKILEQMIVEQMIVEQIIVEQTIVEHMFVEQMTVGKKPFLVILFLWAMSVVIFQDVVRKLKKFFNGKFDAVFEEKEEVLEKIKLLNERLRAVVLELR